jgi:hypothetical protein
MHTTHITTDGTDTTRAGSAKGSAKGTVPRDRTTVRTEQVYRLSRHALERQAERGIGDLAIRLAVRFGRRYWRAGCQVYFLGRRHIPAGLDPDTVRRVEGTAVVVAPDGNVCTVYRNHDLPRRLRHPDRPLRRARRAAAGEAEAGKGEAAFGGESRVARERAGQETER